MASYPETLSETLAHPPALHPLDRKPDYENGSDKPPCFTDEVGDSEVGHLPCSQPTTKSICSKVSGDIRVRPVPASPTRRSEITSNTSSAIA